MIIIGEPLCNSLLDWKWGTRIHRECNLPTRNLFALELYSDIANVGEPERVVRKHRIDEKGQN